MQGAHLHSHLVSFRVSPIESAITRALAHDPEEAITVSMTDKAKKENGDDKQHSLSQVLTLRMQCDCFFSS